MGGAYPQAPLPYFTPALWGTLALAALFCFGPAWPRVERAGIRLLAASHFSARQALGLSVSTVALVLLAASYLIGSSYNPFIYFRF
jgi:alginate O-acetyltransferase complex protein AlgI